MPIFQPGGNNAGYRGPAKTLTIKALQDRQAAMQAAAEANAANAAPVTNMWQGAGALVNQLGDSMQQSRAAGQEADARAQLAGIMAGIDPNKGASMEQIAAMQQLDPEFANAEYARAMGERAKIADREDAQEFTGGQNDLTRQAEADRQRELFGQQDKTAEELAREADKTRADEAAIADAASKRDAAEAARQAGLEAAFRGKTPTEIQQAVEAGLIPPELGKKLTDAYVGAEEAGATKAGAEATEAVQEATPASPMTPAEAARWGGDVAKNPGDWYLDPKDGRPKKLSEYNAGAAAAEKTQWDTKGTINSIDNTLNELQRAVELAPDVMPLGRLGQTAADWAAYAPDFAKPEDFQKSVDATKRFNQIMESGAMVRMAEELKGSTAYQEMQAYVRILADPQTSLDVKKQTLAAFINRLQSERGVMAEKAKSSGLTVAPYTYTNPDVLPGTVTDPAATAPVVDDRPAVEKYKPRTGR